jgi:hypothetical protein
MTIHEHPYVFYVSHHWPEEKPLFPELNLYEIENLFFLIAQP